MSWNSEIILNVIHTRLGFYPLEEVKRILEEIQLEQREVQLGYRETKNIPEDFELG